MVAGGGNGGSGGMRGENMASPQTHVLQHASGAMLQTRSQSPKPLAKLHVTFSPSNDLRISSLSTHSNGGGGGRGGRGGGGGVRGTPSGSVGGGGRGGGLGDGGGKEGG
eukprot:scaffold72449_cov30-Tisochrysis_lutea.AAC.10